MLDVHAPHQKIHTWTDFFIHIAVIVVGLLIAIGLEQLVEHVHHRYELRETRAALDLEMRGNTAKLAIDEREWLFTYALLKNDLRILRYIREHPGTPQTALPGVLGWIQRPFLWDHTVWDAAVNKGVVRYMSSEEANRWQLFYSVMTNLYEQNLAAWDALNDARRFDLLDSDPTHLSPAELSEVIQRTEFALAKHLQTGYSLGRYALEFPQFPHTITYDRIAKLRPSYLYIDPTLAAARHTTEDEVNALMSDFGLTQDAQK